MARSACPPIHEAPECSRKLYAYWTPQLLYVSTAMYPGAPVVSIRSHCVRMTGMPKKVDHRERRNQIAEALLRVAASRGLEAVSLRHVAEEAGVSTGMVQHYFKTKDEMMAFAMGVVSESVQSQLSETRQPIGNDAPREVVRALLTQMLPLDERRRLGGHVTIAFYAYAAVRPSVAADRRASTAELETFLAKQIRAARNGARLEPEDPSHEALALLALTEGLNILTLVGYCSPETTRAVFDTYLEAVFGKTPTASQ